MHPDAIKKARSRLRIVSKAIEDIPKCDGFDAFSDVWYAFLVAAKNVYTSLEQGSKASPQSRQWFGGKKQERKDDPLLLYLFQARDDDEHGLAPVTKQLPPNFAIGLCQEGESTNFDSSFVGGKFEVRSRDGKPIYTQTIQRVELLPVHGRGRTYDPPREHKGKPLKPDQSITTLMEAALSHLTALVDEAERLA